MIQTIFGRESRQARGFTLIELLVVIAIIALLAAILFPVFARARENARRSSCQSNEKQLALAMHQYVQDYDEYFPYVYWSGYNGGNMCWAGVIAPYTKSDQIYTCPSFGQAIKTSAASNGANAAGGYGMNWPIFASNDNYGFLIKMSRIARSSELVMIGETKNGATSTDGVPYLYNPIASTYVASNGSPTGNYSSSFDPNTRDTHFDGMNVAFSDGHVKWFRKDWLKGQTSLWTLD